MPTLQLKKADRVINAVNCYVSKENSTKNAEVEREKCFKAIAKPVFVTFVFIFNSFYRCDEAPSRPVEPIEEPQPERRKRFANATADAVKDIVDALLDKKVYFCFFAVYM